MNRKAITGIMLTLLLTSMLTFAFNFQSVKTDSLLPLISLNPSQHTVTAPGQNFTVDVNITGVTSMQGYEFQLLYNSTILNATAVSKVLDPSGTIWGPVGGPPSYPWNPIHGNYAPYVVACDVNSDGAVNLLDLIQVSINVGPVPPGHPCDVNGDGVVNVLDIILVLTNLGSVPATAPEIGRVWVMSAFSLGNAFSGSTTAVRINFTTLAYGTCTLHLNGTELGDTSGLPIDHTTLDGSVTVVNSIKIGVLGPMAWTQGQALKEGAEIAKDEINDGGGILGHPVELVFADTLRGQPEPNTTTGAAAAMELVNASCDFVVGGFRTEAVYGAREVFMDSALASDKPIFFIDGAATNELIDDGTGSDPATVRSNYTRYRFMFRVMPVNSTMLLYSLAAFCKYVMVMKLAPIFTGIPGYCTEPLKISVISEDLPWADVMHAYLTSEAFWNHAAYMDMAMTLRGVAWDPGNMSTYGVDVVAPARVNSTATDVSSELLAVEAAGAKLLIHVLSGPVGHTLITQWKDLEIQAVPVGIDVVGQEIPLHWEATGGNCEYETLLAVSGTRTPISAEALAFWDAYEARWGHAPIYTSYGAYDTVMLIKETIEAAGRWPMGARELVPLIEQTDRDSTLGRFKFTGPHPMSSATYDAYMANATHSYLDINPTMKGTLHDVYMRPEDLGPVWYPPYYTRPLFVQWQKSPITGKARLEVVWPRDQAYSKKWRIPTWIYSLAETDISGAYGFPDGLVDIYDIGLLASAYMTTAGDVAWNLEADSDGNGIINIVDLDRFARDWGKNVSLPLNMAGVPMDTASPVPAITQTNSNTTVYLDQPTIITTGDDVNDIITVYINISDAVGVHGWQAGLTFNSTHLECTGFYEFEFLASHGGTIWETPSGINIDNDAGVVFPHGCTLSCEVSANGFGQLAYFYFKVKEAGVSDLHLHDVVVTDYYEWPKMVPFNIIDTYTVTSSPALTSIIVSNSTGQNAEYGSGFYNHTFSHPDEELSFNVTGPSPGWSNVTIPKTLLNISTLDQLLVIVDDEPLKTYERTVTQNDTHYFVHFNYTLGTRNIHILKRPPVYNINKNRYYATLQKAINSAQHGHEILAYPGIHNENVVVNETVTLIGENKQNTIIDGGGTGTVINVTANNVNISNFTIQNSGNPEYGILVYGSSGNNISHNIITNNWIGIYLYDSSNNILDGNNASNNEYGIMLTGSMNTLTNNTMSGNKYNFGLYGSISSHFNNTIDESNTVDGKPVYYVKEASNTVYNSSTNAGTIYLIDCTNITIRDLALTKNVNGIFLWNTTNSKIQNVTASNNLNGIYLQGQSNYNNITDNTVSDNELGIYLYHSNDTDIYHNILINNLVQANVTESYNNHWDDGYPSGGNYWSDHTHSDYYTGPYQNKTGNDGIVDIPYVINANNTDNYPLVSPLTTPVFNINTHLGYTIIQQAINAFNTLQGHTIIVRAGTYHEHVIINKSLTVIGIIGSTVIDGDGNGTVVTITTDDVTLRGFTIQGSGSSMTDSGIFLSSADNVVINQNNITQNENGIYVNHSDGCSIGGNNIKANPYSGIRLESSGSTNIIINNLTDNYYGIFLKSSNGNYIHDNNLTDNDEGIHLDSSNYNTIYHNNFINNTIQVYLGLDSPNNTWDDGYPSGGNYWSDYTGVDEKSGPNQDQPGNDSIGDTAYEVHQQTEQQDNYPLVNLWIQPHDVAMISVTPSRTLVASTCRKISISVTIENHGYFTETFVVTVYYNLTNQISSQEVTLTSGSPTTITFTWNTAGVPYGKYTITANATTVPDETDLTDNAKTGGWVKITRIGNVNGDDAVNVLDIILVITNAGPVPPKPPECDINCDNTINVLDIILVLVNVGPVQP